MLNKDELLKAVEKVDREVAQLAARVPAENAASLDDFRVAWGRLVDLLVLGKAPGRRACPFCGAVGAMDATWCGRCRKQLLPDAATLP